MAASAWRKVVVQRDWAVARTDAQPDLAAANDDAHLAGAVDQPAGRLVSATGVPEPLDLLEMEPVEDAAR
jgi:hypothetical protein